MIYSISCLKRLKLSALISAVIGWPGLFLRDQILLCHWQGVGPNPGLNFFGYWLIVCSTTVVLIVFTANDSCTSASAPSRMRPIHLRPSRMSPAHRIGYPRGCVPHIDDPQVWVRIIGNPQRCVPQIGDQQGWVPIIGDEIVNYGVIYCTMIWIG